MEKEKSQESAEKAILGLYQSIKSEIYQKEIQIEDLQKINLLQIVNYLKQSIEILVNLRIERTLKKQSERENIQGDCSSYENLIKKLEDDIRNHIKVFFFKSQLENEMKIHLDYLQAKLEVTIEENPKIRSKRNENSLKQKDKEIESLNKLLVSKDDIISELNSLKFNSSRKILACRPTAGKENGRSISMTDQVSLQKSIST